MCVSNVAMTCAQRREGVQSVALDIEFRCLLEINHDQLATTLLIENTGNKSAIVIPPMSRPISRIIAGSI